MITYYDLFKEKHIILTTISTTTHNTAQHLLNMCLLALIKRLMVDTGDVLQYHVSWEPHSAHIIS